MNRITSTEIADLRGDVRQIHETLTEYKQEAAAISRLLDEQLALIDDDDRGSLDTTDRVNLLQDTRELAQSVFLRVEYGDAALRKDVPQEEQPEDDE